MSLVDVAFLVPLTREKGNHTSQLSLVEPRGLLLFFYFPGVRQLPDPFGFPFSF